MTASDFLLAFLTAGAIATLHAQPGAHRELAALRFLAAAPGWRVGWVRPWHVVRLLEVELESGE